MLYNVKFIGFFSNPKIVGTVLLMDLTGAFSFINKYIFADINYLKFLVVAVIIDLITGLWKVAVTEGVKKITSKNMRIGTVSKVVSYASFLILIHILTHYEVDGKASTSLLWINKFALEFLIFAEARSIYENIVAVNPKLDFIDPLLQGVVNKFKTKK